MNDKTNPTGNYEVGYGKPPKAHQFKENISGNPKGRPKGARNLKTDLLEELLELMTIREGDSERRVSKQRALIKTLVARGLNGNDTAAGKIIDLYLRVAGLELDATDADLPLSQDEAAVIKSLEERLLRRASVIPPQADGDHPGENEYPGENS